MSQLFEVTATTLVMGALVLSDIGHTSNSNLKYEHVPKRELKKLCYRLTVGSNRCTATGKKKVNGDPENLS